MAITVSNNAQLIGSLFTSMSSNRLNNVSNSLFASTDLLGINYMDYSSIKSGSYHKLLSAYYSLDDDKKSETQTVTKKKDNLTTSASTDSVSKLASIEKDAEKMKDAADALLTQGTKSLFKQVSVTDDKGNITKEYDTEGIYKAVKAFTDQYNSLVTTAGSSRVSRIASSAASMYNYTSQNEKLLASVGITLDEDKRTVSIDEEAFRKADMSTVKSLFNGTGSYAYQVSVKASMIDYYAQNEASKANTYSSSGKYSYNYNSGSVWNGWV